MPKSNTLNRLTTLLTIIALVAIIGIAATTVHAATTKSLILKYNISVNLTDARINKVAVHAEYPISILFTNSSAIVNETNIYKVLYLEKIPPYYFTRYREFKLIIANASTVYYITPTNKTALYHSPINITTIAATNKTGGLVFRVWIPLSYAKLIAYWKIVILVKAWGRWWIAANFTTAFPMALSTLLKLLAKIGTGKVGVPVINSLIYRRILERLGTNDITASVCIKYKKSGRHIVCERWLIYATNANYTIFVYVPKIKPEWYVPGVPYSASSAQEEKIMIYHGRTLKYEYHAFVYGAEYFKHWKMYALWLPYIQSFVVAVNAINIVDCTFFKIKFTMVLPSGAKSVIYEAQYNKTLSKLLRGLGYICVFGPIYYLTPLYKGMEIEKIPKVPSGFKPYKPLVVLTQTPFGSLYFVLDVYYKTKVAGEYVDTFEITSVPRGLANFGVIALPTYPLVVKPGQMPAIVGVGLYGYVRSKAGSVIQPFIYLRVPKTEYHLNVEKLRTLLNTKILPELENRLSYRWYEVTSSGSRIFISTGPATTVTLVGKKYFNIKLESGYTVKYTYRGPIFSFNKYFVEVYYGYDPILVLDITGLVNRTLFKVDWVEFPNVTVKTSLVPVVIRIRRYVPGINVTEAPSLTISPKLYHKMVVLIYRSMFPALKGTLYLTGNVTYSCVMGDSVVVRKVYVLSYSSAIYLPLIYLVTRMPVKYEITYNKKLKKFEVKLVGPRVNNTYYYYHIYVYYGNPKNGGIQIGVALFAVGSYTVIKGTKPVRINAWVWPVAGYEVLNAMKKSKIINFADKLARIKKFYIEVNYSGALKITKSITVHRVYELYEAVSFIALMTYFETLYRVPLSKALLTDVSATVSVVRIYKGKTVVVAVVPARYVEQILIPVPTTMVNGWPKVGATSAVYTFILNYAGYKLQAVNLTTGKPLYLTVRQLLRGLVWKEIAFPIVYEWFKIESSSKVPLPGFVIQVFSVKTGEELWRAITNSKGLAYVGALPANKPVKIVVRTIVPSEDRKWFIEHLNANKTLSKYNNTYVEYASMILGYKPYSYVYTLGTRGPLDAGLIANITVMKIPSKFGKKIIYPIANIRPVKVYAVYKEGNKYILLNTLPVYPCAIPLNCPAILYNVSMVIYGGVYPRASTINKTKFADFRIIGINGIRSIYERHADAYLSEARKALTHYEETGDKSYLVSYVRDMSYYVALKLVALASSDTLYAMFYIPPVYGVGNVWRIIMPGQTFDIQIYYLGYRVFDNYVTIPPYNITYIVTPKGRTYIVTKPLVVYTMTGKPVVVKPGSIVIITSVKPVTFKLLTRDNETLRNVYLALVLTDSLTRTFVAGRYSSQLATIVKPILKPFNTVSPLSIVATITMLNRTAQTTVKGYVVYVPTDLAAVVNGTEPWYFTGHVTVKDKTSASFAAPIYYEDIRVVVYEHGQPKIYSLKTVGVPEGSKYGTALWLLATPSKITKIGAKLIPLSSTLTTVTFMKKNVTRNKLGAVMLVFNASKAYELKNLWVKVVLITKHGKNTLIGPVNITKYVIKVLRSPRLVRIVLPIPHEELAGLTFKVVNVTYSVSRPCSGSPPTYSITGKTLPNGTKVVTVEIQINATGYGSLNVATYLYAGIPVEIISKNVPVLKIGPSKYKKTMIDVAKPVKPWENIFGSPIMIITPVSSGEVTIPLPEWTVTTNYANATIARIYIFNATPVRGLVSASDVTTETIEGIPYPIVSGTDYLLLNLVRLSEGAYVIYVGLTGVVTSESGAAIVLGPLTGATSTLVYLYSYSSPEVLFSVPLMPSTVTLRSTVITRLGVENKNVFDIILLPKFVIKAKSWRVIPIEAVTPTAYVSLISDLVVPALSFENISVEVSYRYWPPNYTFYIVTPSGLKKRVVTSAEVAKYEVFMKSNLTSAIYFAYNHTYSSPALLRVPELGVVIPVESASSGYISLGKVVIERKPILALSQIFGWNGKPLVNATVAVFVNRSSNLCRPLAVTYVGSNGSLISILPYGRRTVVFWYDSYIRYLETVCKPLTKVPKSVLVVMSDSAKVAKAKATTERATVAAPSMKVSKMSPLAEFEGPVVRRGVPIIIYDSAKSEDVQKLGNAVANVSSIYTWVYSLVLQVLNKNGLPLKNAIVVVRDAATGGEYFYASAKLNGTGGAVIRDIRTAYSGVVSNVPASNLLIDVFIPVGHYLIPVLVNYPLNLQRGSSSPVFVTTVRVNTAYITLPITVQLQVPGMKAMPLAGAEVKVTEYVPAVSYVTYGSYIVPEMSTLTTVKAGTWTLKTGSSGIVTVGPLNIAATGVTTLDIEIVKVNELPLGYTETVQLTSANVTPPVITIPGAEVKVLAVSASGSPLSIATVNVTCRYGTTTVYTGYGKGSLTFVLPLPRNVASSPIVCEAVAVAPGHVKSKVYELTITRPSTYELRVRVPVTGWYIPGIGYVGWPQIALWIVIIFIVIIIIVIGLIEYQHWRRKRLVSILERPPSGGR